MSLLYSAYVDLTVDIVGSGPEGALAALQGSSPPTSGTVDRASAAMMEAGGALIASAPVEVQENREAED